MPKVEVYDKQTQTRYTVENASKFRDSERYEILTAEDADKARRDELSALKRDQLAEIATGYNLDSAAFKKNADFVNAILKHEAGTTDADNA